jgi:hypothetical protein
MKKLVDGALVEMTSEEIAAFKASRAPGPVPVPTSVTPLQMRKALRAAGLKAQADAYLATLPEEAQEEWEFCISVNRDNAFIASAVTALGMSKEQADDLFRLAATL